MAARTATTAAKPSHGHGMRHPNPSRGNNTGRRNTIAQPVKASTSPIDQLQVRVDASRYMPPLTGQSRSSIASALQMRQGQEGRRRAASS